MAVWLIIFLPVVNGLIHGWKLCGQFIHFIAFVLIEITVLPFKAGAVEFLRLESVLSVEQVGTG